MIVRISGEDQYVLPDTDRDRLNELDNAVVTECENGQEDAFAESYAELLDFVRARIARYKAPRSVDFTDNLPRSATGKLVKHELKARYRPTPASS